MVLPISSPTVNEGMPRGPGSVAPTTGDAFLLLLAAFLGLGEAAASVADGDASAPKLDASGQAESPKKVLRDEHDVFALLALTGSYPIPVGVRASPVLGEEASLPSPEVAPVGVQTVSAVGPAQQLAQPVTGDGSPSLAPSGEQTATSLAESLAAATSAGAGLAEVEGALRDAAPLAGVLATEESAAGTVSQLLGSVAVPGKTEQAGVRTGQPRQIPAVAAVGSDAVSQAGQVVPRTAKVGDAVLIPEPANLEGVLSRHSVEPERAAGEERIGILPNAATVPGIEQRGLARPVEAGGPVPDADVPGQVQEELSRALERGARQIRVRLEPPELGVVDIRVREIGGRLEVTLAASRPDVHQALEAGREGLRTALAASGFAVQRVEVQPGFAASGQGTLGGGQSGTGWNGGQHGFASDTGSGRWSGAPTSDRVSPRDESVRVGQLEMSGLVDTRV